MYKDNWTITKLHLRRKHRKIMQKVAKRIKDNFNDHRLYNLFQVNPNGKYYPKFANTTRYRDY